MGYMMNSTVVIPTLSNASINSIHELAPDPTVGSGRPKLSKVYKWKVQLQRMTWRYHGIAYYAKAVTLKKFGGRSTPHLRYLKHIIAE